MEFHLTKTDSIRRVSSSSISPTNTEEMSQDNQNKTIEEKYSIDMPFDYSLQKTINLDSLSESNFDISNKEYTTIDFSVEDLFSEVYFNDTQDNINKKNFIPSSNNILSDFDTSGKELFQKPTFEELPSTRLDYIQPLSKLQTIKNTMHKNYKLNFKIKQSWNLLKKPKDYLEREAIFNTKIQTQTPKFVYSRSTLEHKAMIMNEIRDIIKSVELTEDDTSDEAILEYGYSCGYTITSEAEENELRYEQKEYIENYFSDEIKEKYCIQDLADEELNQVIINEFNELTPKEQLERKLTLIKEGLVILENGDIKNIPRASKEHLLQNKQLKTLKAIGERLKEKNSLRANYEEFKSLYEQNGSPKDIASILTLIEYHIHTTLPGIRANFSQQLLHLSQDPFHGKEAHYLPALNNMDTYGIFDVNALEENRQKDTKNKGGILPLDITVATGISVCQQAAELAKYLLDSLKDDIFKIRQQEREQGIKEEDLTEDIEYQASYNSAAIELGLINDPEYVNEHFDINILTSDSNGNKEVYCYDPANHKVKKPLTSGIVSSIEPELVLDFRGIMDETEQVEFAKVENQYKVQLKKENMLIKN